MPRILFVVPYPVSRIRVRSYGFIKHLGKQHSLTVLALGSDKENKTEVAELQNEGITVIMVREKFFLPYLRSLRALGGRLPLQVAFGASSALKSAVNEQLISGQFDLLHVEHIRALGVIPDALPIPVVWDAVDCVSRLFKQGAQLAATPLLRFNGKREAQRLRIYEHEQTRRFRHVLVTSDRDRQAFLEHWDDLSLRAAEEPVGTITTLPHGVDQEYYQCSTGPRLPETLVFSGKMSYHANIAGVLHLVEHIMPYIWKQRPAVRLIIAGSNPSRSVRRLARDARIQVTGYVPDLRPYIAQAQIAVSPLPYAVGIQNKLIEAMALGTPVVASSHASSGLHVVAGHDLLVADDPQAFADAVLRLLDDQTLWNALAAAGVAYIATSHNWKSIIEQLNAIYAQALDEANFVEASSMI